MNTTTEKPVIAGPSAPLVSHNHPKRRPKWVRLADEARHAIAQRNGWNNSLNPDTQIAREIASNPVMAKAFLRSAKGQKGNDPQALRHRLLAEVRRSLPERAVHLSRWKRFQRKLAKFFRR